MTQDQQQQASDGQGEDHASPLLITHVSSAEDLAAVQDLVRGFMAWVLERYADETWIVTDHYPPQTVEPLIQDLGRLHGPPHGLLLLARLANRPAGCVMLHRLTPGVGEIKRLFVADFARGQGLAAKLCRRLMEEAVSLGYQRLVLDTGVRQNEAVALYERLGFRKVPSYHDYPAKLAAKMISMEIDLV